MFDIITVGSATIDVFAKTEAELIDIHTCDGDEVLIAYPCGTKILISDLAIHTGGGGTNTAVAFSRLGLKTAYLGRLGDDSNAEIILSLLKKENIEFIGTKGKIQTGYSVVLDSIKDDRTILTFKGANSNLMYKDINKRMLGTQWFYFSSMIGPSYKTLEKISEYARRNKIKVAFNPSSYLVKKGTAYLNDLLKNTYLLILNREEAETLVGHNPMVELLKNLRIIGPRIAVVTDGRNGAWAYDGQYQYFIKPRKVRIRETTGAGDSFASGVVAGLVYGKDLSYSLRLGMANASSVIRHMGAKNKLLTLPEAKIIMKSSRVSKKKVK